MPLIGGFLRSLPEGEVRTRLCAGGRWIRTIGTAYETTLLLPRSVPQFAFRDKTRLFRWSDSSAAAGGSIGRYGGDRDQAGVASPLARSTPSPEPEPKRQTLTAPSASDRALPGFKCRE